MWIDYFREPDTTPATERIALLTSVVCGLVITAIFVLFNRVLVGFFVELDTPAAQLAMEGFPYYASAFVFFIFNLTVIGIGYATRAHRAAQSPPAP